jgi:(p)ppGpp synthase/HD superfamily hydrolase
MAAGGRDPQEFLSNLKIDLYPEEVYTFTPRGTVKVLPKGATAIDFAYAIHTDVGHQCVGARVNGAWCRSAPASRTATSSRSSATRRTSRAATG